MILSPKMLLVTLAIFMNILISLANTRKTKIRIQEGTENEYNIKKAKCVLPSNLVKEIQSYQKTADLIIRTLTNGNFKGRTYNDLEKFVDQFEHRIPGSKVLDQSLSYLETFLKKKGLKVTTEKVVNVTQWKRGSAKATLIEPHIRPIKVLGLGNSIGTPPNGIKAEILVVRSFDELKQDADKAKGKIIVFNQDYTTYGASKKYRYNGAVEAAKVGGVAAFVRSVTDFSIHSIHAGIMEYNTEVKKIPTASITVEDAQYLYRMQQRGSKMVIHFKMDDGTLLPMTESKNVIGDLEGREKPNEFVIISGHVDNWDVGQGAMDDGGGVFITVEALALLKSLNLIPRRTLRAVLFTTEETDTSGATTYLKNHKKELDNYSAVMESDDGTFSPLGLNFVGSHQAGCIIKEILGLLKSTQATQFNETDFVGLDVHPMVEKNVPGLSLVTQDDKYFWFHHTDGDTISVQNSNEMDLCTATWAISSYVLADLSIMLPRIKTG